MHLDAVAKIAQPFGETAAVIAYLHDVAEDTSVGVDEIESEFGSLVADAVAILTDEPGENRKERKSKTYKKMAGVSGVAEIALVVKAADRLANVRACVADKKHSLLAVYAEEHPVFRNAAYRADACDEVWSELDRTFYD